LEDMRASKELTETEAQELGSHSRTMMDLNRQLQASAMSTKVKTIEMELRKMEAQEASEHLTIVQLFLPEAFHSERDSLLALLRFKRIGFKSRLLHGFMKERLTSPSPHAQSDHLLAACDALDKLTWISAMCERFTNSITGSSLKQFAKFESSLYELEPVERTLNGYIENLRKDELREQQVADGLQRSIAVMSHLSELHLRDGVESYAEEVLMKTLLMQSNLESMAAALLTTKAEILKAIPASEESDDEISSLIDNADTVVMQSRSAKVIVGKIIRSLQELKARSLALTSESQPNFDTCQSTTADLSASLRTLGLSVYHGIHEEGRPSPFALSDLLSVVREFNTKQYDATDANVFAPLQAKLKSLHERLSDIYSVASDLSMTIEFERTQPPWVLRSKELQDSTIVSASAEQEITSLKREIHERATALKLRDQTLEESNVKIELLEARMRDVTKKANKITELEKAVEAARVLERKLEKKLEERAFVNAKLEEERDRWMRKAAEMSKRDSTAGELRNGGVDLVGTSAEMDALKREITALESAISFLRKQTSRKRAEEDAMANSWLQQPLLPKLKDAELLNKRQESTRAFEKLAELPKTATPLILEGVKDRSERLKWMPRKATPQYHLAELEMHWLETWEPGMIATKGNWLGGLGGAAVSVR
jgi:dynactin 1